MDGEIFGTSVLCTGRTLTYALRFDTWRTREICFQGRTLEPFL